MLICVHICRSCVAFLKCSRNLALNQMSQKTTKKVQGNDAFQRMNYLYQLSKAIVAKNPVLASYYGNLIVSIGKKNVLRLHPEIKRQICRKCKCILVNNVSAKMKIKSKKKSKIIEWVCNTCKTNRSFPATKNKDHNIWMEKPEAVAEVIS